MPLVGDRTSAAQRAAAPDAWAFPAADRDVLAAVLTARRDVRRFRPDPVTDEVLTRVLTAGHAAPSVGHSQPWRFLVLDEPDLRQRAALLADRERLAQAAQLDPDSARRLLDLQLEGIREAPIGVVVCCDRRTPAAGVLGRATFPDADLWSCACAIQNMWLTARAEGLGLGWVTLFRPADLADLLGLPDGVVTLGWLCLGWPDERPPAPGLERAGWSSRAPLADVVVHGRWPGTQAPASPPSRLRAPGPADVVAARDAVDDLLAVPGALGVLDRAVDRLVAAGATAPLGGTAVLVAGRHAVASLGVTPYAEDVTEHVLQAARAGASVGAVAADEAALQIVVVDAGRASGDLLHEDALPRDRVRELLDRGREVGRGSHGDVVTLGEVGIGNTTVAAALTARLLGRPAEDVVGLGTGADASMLQRKRDVVAGALARVQGRELEEPADLLAALGGPEFAVLTGVVLGVAERGAVVVLDGLATSVCALLAIRLDPGCSAYLIAGQRSRERAHGLVLDVLGLEPLLDLRLRAGEGAGAALAVHLLSTGMQVRLRTAQTAEPTQL